MTSAYGTDYFLSVIEQRYGKRFVANYNALYEQINKVQQEAEKTFL